MKHTFSVTLSDGAFEVPLDVRAIFGEARPAVKMTFCGETYRTRVAVYGGKYICGIWKAELEKHGLRDGKKLEVTLEPDTEPRKVEPPKELAAVLKKNAAARAGWEAMSFTHQREWAQAIADAKKPETREKRIAQATRALTARARAKPKRATGKKRA
jgi:Bacteriocin-protection, YdeI or OmpD-Associated/Domain of unknown function (DUF1905)